MGAGKFKIWEASIEKGPARVRRRRTAYILQGRDPSWRLISWHRSRHISADGRSLPLCATVVLKNSAIAICRGDCMSSLRLPADVRH